MDSGAAIAPSIHRQQRYVNDEYEDENILLQKELFMHALHKGLGPQTEAQNVLVQLVQFYTSKKSSQIVKVKWFLLHAALRVLVPTLAFVHALQFGKSAFLLLKFCTIKIIGFLGHLNSVQVNVYFLENHRLLFHN